MSEIKIKVGEEKDEKFVSSNDSKPKEQNNNLPLPNPFPGLRPFDVEESHLFFGREGQSDEVLMKMLHNKFVAVIGASGAGKSSFLFCGVIPILYGGFMTETGSNWNVVVARPGSAPIDNLAESLLRSNVDYVVADKEEKRVRKKIISTLLRSSSLGLVEAVSQTKSSVHQNVLILIDQFEELFRFKKSEDGQKTINEALAFVNLLTEAARQKDVPVYVAITMRSDFIGDCAQFPELTKNINDSHYLIPQMTREQKRLAIVGPVAVGGGAVSPRLLQQLLNDLGDNPDQLPIMQHALMRTWAYWADNRESEEPIDLKHYEAIGKMEEALSMHANEAYDDLTEKEKDICQIMFKALTEKSSESAHGIRRPTRLATIAAIANTSTEEITKIVETFRKPGRSLLMPPAGIPLNNDSVIDISHESLMRIWVRLKMWVEEESESVQMYLRLSEASAMYQQGKTGLWRPPDLQVALNWYDKNKPTLDWGQRYDPAYERAIVFLETSKKEFEAEQRMKEMMQKRTLKRTRIVALILALAAILSIGIGIWAITQKVEADKQRLEALAAKKNAERQEKIAKKAEQNAIAQRKEAEHQKEIAVQALSEAERQKAEAERQKALAEKQKELALIAKNEAVAAKERALESEKNALEQKAIADEQSRIAQEQKKKADNLRLLSIAKSMAVKSVSMSDTVTKALLAQQAYKFHSSNGGSKHNHDIYEGLYFAVKFLKQEDYNALKGHSDAIRTMKYAPDGKSMFSAGSDSKVIQWNISDDSRSANVIDSVGFVIRSVEVTPNNKWLAISGDATYIKLYDLADTDAKPFKLKAHSNRVTDLAFSKDSKTLISVGLDSTVNLWDVANQTSAAIFKAGSKVRSVSFNKDDSKIYIGTQNGKVIELDRNNNYAAKTLVDHQGKAVHEIAIANSGNFLVSGDDFGKVKIYSFKDAKLVNVLKDHTARIEDIAFSDDDKYLATASFDHTVRLWNFNNLNEEPLILRDHNMWVWSVAFSKDGNKLYAGCGDNLIRVWPTNYEFMSNEICDKLPRNMTGKEWTRYVAEEDDKDVQYDLTCPHLPSSKDVIEEIY